MPPQIPPHIDPNEKLIPASFDAEPKTSPKKGSAGPLVGIIIILILLLVGGLYFWKASLDKLKSQSQTNTSSSTVQGW